MTDLKLLFSRYFSHKRILIGVAAFFLLMMAAVMLFHEDPGGDPADFIMCKFSALMPMMMAVCLPVIFMVQDTIGNRFMRSVPCADKLYTRGRCFPCSCRLAGACFQMQSTRRLSCSPDVMSAIFPTCW